MLVAHGPSWAEGAVPAAMVCVPGTNWRCGSQQQSFFWVSGCRTLDFMGHCFKCCGCFDLQSLLQALRSMFSEKTFFFHKICYAFHAKHDAHGDQVHGLLGHCSSLAFLFSTVFLMVSCLHLPTFLPCLCKDFCLDKSRFWSENS